ncbi:chemotaxis-specific protein-glutamate methyltransferase CheB [Altererythrobacter aquaemixtae]|uniref:protein-glutamate methylesterase n=2 Tax=Pontixanthobacter aquaemixtae TaxID=1958940 RepID=A0A844ZNE4_9SPHN|nr:chemotaxis-specific protein-glutamate methyltransferase CheB [Pontixanthobacter aquaemixtae]
MVVDDSLTVRTALTRLIADQPDLEIVGKKSSAELALQALKKTPADVVLLDLEMPGMGGLKALPDILATQNNVQVLVVSTLAEEGAEPTLKALSMGAADTMPKPRSGGFDTEYRETLLAKIRILGRKSNAVAAALEGAQITRPKKVRQDKVPQLLAIGASTGGIHALCSLLQALPKEFHLPILVTQHLPESFMTVFARQIETASSRKAFIAADDMRIERNNIYIAPGHGHLNVIAAAGGFKCNISNESMPSGCTPSVDPMLASASSATDGHAIGVILSGMGRDGSLGAAELVENGGAIFAQDQESSAVWGMPRAVAERGLASALLPPIELADRVMSSLGASPWK